MFKWILKRMKEDEKGFTLIELVIVISILGILAFIAVPRLAGTTTKAANSAHNANVRTLESAATMFIANEGIPKEEKSYGEDADDNILLEYVQKWPKIPKGAIKDKDTPLEGDYTVTIKTDGDITVHPDVIEDE